MQVQHQLIWQFLTCEDCNQFPAAGGGVVGGEHKLSEFLSQVFPGLHSLGNNTVLLSSNQGRDTANILLIETSVTHTHI